MGTVSIVPKPVTPAAAKQTSVPRLFFTQTVLAVLAYIRKRPDMGEVLGGLICFKSLKLSRLNRVGVLP